MLTLLPRRNLRGIDGTDATLLVVRLTGLGMASAGTIYTTRVVVDRYGIDGYAQYSLLMSLVILLPLGTLGVGTPITRHAAENRFCDPRERLPLLAHAARIVIVACLALVLVASVISALGLWNQALGLPRQAHGDVDVPVLLVVVTLCLSSLASMIPAALFGTGGAITVTAWQLLQWPVAIGCLLLCVHVGIAIAWLAPCVLATQAIPPAIVSFTLSRSVVGLGFIRFLRQAAFPGPSVQSSPEGLVRQSGAALSVQLSRVAGMQSDRLVLSHLSTGQQVGLYSVYLQIYAPMLSLLSALTAGLWTVIFSSSDSQLAGQRTLRQVLRFGKLGFLAGLIYTGVAVVVGPGIIQIAAPYNLLFAFSALLLVNSVLQPLTVYYSDRRSLSFFSTCSWAANAINLVISVLTASRFGAAAVVWSTAACNLILGIALTLRLTSDRWQLPRTASGCDGL